MAHPKGDIVKPSALTPKVQKAIVDAMFVGVPLSRAILASGISRPAYYYWKTRHDEGDPSAAIYADFFDNIKKAGAKGEVEALTVIRSGMPGWQGSAWFLERRFPQRWGKQDRAPILPPPAPPKPIKDMTSEELDAWNGELDAYQRRIGEGKGRG